jgi:Ribonuclease G/E
MAKEICISSTPHETRLAILEDDQLAEIYYERENEYTLAGSIYNGRVTRVLPGMQSAFVDVGLERDAFLYVTDFLELEDQEETDELKRPASCPFSRAATRLRASVRHRFPFSGSQTETAEPAENDPQTDGESEFTPSIQATAALSSRTSHAPPSGTPVPFVLPGESLSKYGGAPASDAPANTSPTPVRPASTFKPSTLIEAPLAWDGSGLLPGESLSRHRNREPENTTRTLEESAAALDEISEDEFVSERAGSVSELHAAEAAEATPEEFISPVAENYFAQQEPVESELIEDEPFEETTEFAHEAASASEPAPAKPGEAEEYEVKAVFDQPSADEQVAEPVLRQNESSTDLGSNERQAVHSDDEAEKSDATDASASHHVDPSPHTGFRLFGLGKKKKEEPAPVSAPPPAKALSVATVSAFAPGSGVIEEELIDEEEFDAPHHHKADDHRRSMQTSDLPIISDLLKPGQEILVQIAKEPIAKKGARITSHIALPGASWSSCRPSHTSASAARLPPTRSASVSSGFSPTSAARPRADLSFAPPPRAHRKKSCAPICASSSTSGTRSRALRHFQVAGADLSRSAYRAHPARPGQHQLLIDLGRLAGRLRAHRPLPQPLLAHAGPPRQALHQGDSAFRALRHSGRNLQGSRSKGLAQERRLHRHQPDRSAGGHRHQHRQVCRQVGAA